jgi:hypothetical protein
MPFSISKFSPSLGALIIGSHLTQVTQITFPMVAQFAKDGHPEAKWQASFIIILQACSGIICSAFTMLFAPAPGNHRDHQ